MVGPLFCRNLHVQEPVYQMNPIGFFCVLCYNEMDCIHVKEVIRREESNEEII